MARYTGPKTRIARKFGEPIFGTDKYFDKRNYPPGQHGQSKKRKTASEYAVQLKEKYIETALQHLEDIAVVSIRKKPLTELANFLVQRENEHISRFNIRQTCGQQCPSELGATRQCEICGC